MPDKSNDNKARCFSLFNSETAGRFIVVPDEENGSTDYYVVTPFDIVDPEIFPYVINLPLGRVTEYYENIKEYTDTPYVATNMVLQLIHSADLVPLRKDMFLASASDLNEWLILESGECLNYLINRWQIMKRRGDFDDEVKASIREFLLDSSISMTSRLACSILLENKDDAKFLFGKLSESDQQDFQEWPIWKLYEDLL